MGRFQEWRKRRMARKAKRAEERAKANVPTHQQRVAGAMVDRATKSKGPK